MSASREYRNLGKVEDAITLIGVAITVAENTIDTLSYALPDDTPAIDLFEVRKAHEDVQKVLGL